MMKRILTALIVLFCIACNQRNSVETQPTTKAPIVPAHDNPVLLGQPADMRKAMLAAYRLKPDQRFLLAIADIHHIVTGQPEEKAEAGFEGDVWSIRYKGSVVGTVPELPDFPDILSCLTSFSRELSKQYPMPPANLSENDPEIESGIQRFFSPDEINVLKRIDRLWLKNKSPYLLYSAARAAVRLNLQSVDQLQIADSVPAHALALLALADSLNQYNLKAEQALLSQAMGYTGFAARRTAEFAADDPIRLFVEQNPGLEGVAKDRNAPVLSRYLRLRQVSRRNDGGLWEHTRDSLFPGAKNILAVVSTGLAVQPPNQDEARHLGYLDLQLPESIFHELTGQNVVGSRSFEPATVKEFESKLQSVAGPGPFSSSIVLRAFYRGDFYSGVYWEYHHFNRHLQIEEGPIAAEFDPWVKDMELINHGNPAFANAASDILRFKVIGEPALDEISDRFMRMTSFDSSAIPHMARLLASRMDTRIEARLDLGYIARYHIRDNPLTSRLYGSILSSASNGDCVAVAQCAIFKGDWEKVGDILGSDPCNAACAKTIFQYWEMDFPKDLAPIRAEFEVITQRFPHDWDLTYEWMQFLRDHQLYAEACLAGEKWMHANNHPSDVGYFHSHIVRAHTYYMAGQYKQGLAALEDVKNTGATEVSRESAELLAALGKKDEAEALARTAKEQAEDDTPTVMVLAVVYWINGKYAEAADVVSSLPLSTDLFFREVALPFYYAFRDRPVKDAIAAVAAMRSKHILNASLMGCATWFETKGRPDIAFQIQASLQPGAAVDEDVALYSFQLLKQWKGEKEAIAWLDKLLPHEQRNPMSVKFLYSSEYPLLWDFIGDPSSRPMADLVWFTRAIASAYMEPNNDPHRQELLTHFSRPENKDYLGKYLVGLIADQELFTHATTPGDRCEISHCIGVVLDGKGLYEDASDWYRVAIETGQRHVEGWHLSFRRLGSWPKGAAFYAMAKPGTQPVVVKK